MRVYISGPITGIRDYRKAFDDAEKKLTEKGYTAVNPAKLADILPETTTTWNEYMVISMALLNLCEGILMLPGWEESAGAKIERSEAIHSELQFIEI